MFDLRNIAFGPKMSRKCMARRAPCHVPREHESCSQDLAALSNTDYCKTRFFRVPFISQISRAWQVHENNRPQKFEYSNVSV